MTDDNIIVENIRIIKQGFDPEKYPVLSRCFSKGKREKHLLFILSYMKNHYFDTVMGELSYWKIPFNYFEKACKASRETWQSHISFFGKVGLIVPAKPSKDTKNHVMQAAYREAVAKKKKPPTFYSCRLYTEDQLEAAEKIARRYAERGASFSHFRKKTMIRTDGQQAANIFFQNTFTLTDEDREAERLIVEAIEGLIISTGYATKGKAMEAARKEAEGQEKLLRAITRAGEQLTLLCQDHGLIYRRVRREDHEKWGLTYGRKIILPPGI